MTQCTSMTVAMIYLCPIWQRVSPICYNFNEQITCVGATRGKGVVEGGIVADLGNGGVAEAFSLSKLKGPTVH